MKKYELTSEYVEFDGRKLYRIKALKSFYLCGLTVKAGALGGYIEKEENLSQEGNAWIHGNASIRPKTVEMQDVRQGEKEKMLIYHTTYRE